MDNIVSRDTMRQRGAAAFDRDVSIDGHNMDPGAPAIIDWQAGWRERQAVVYAREAVGSMLAQAEVSPP